MESVHGIELTLFIALIFAIPVGAAVRNYTGLALGLNGLLAGWFVGGLFYCLITAVLGWNSFIGFITLTAIFGIAGLFMAFQFGWQMVLYGTSLVGSYVFMRSCTLIFSFRWDGFPNEYEIYAKLQDGKDVADEFIDWQFWVYVLVFLLMFYFTANYQKKYEKVHEDLQKYDDDFHNADSVDADNFVDDEKANQVE